MLVRMAVPVFSSVESMTLMSLFSSSFDSSEINWVVEGVVVDDVDGWRKPFLDESARFIDKWLFILACNSAWDSFELEDWRVYGFWDDTDGSLELFELLKEKNTF